MINLQKNIIFILFLLYGCSPKKQFVRTDDCCFDKYGISDQDKKINPNDFDILATPSSPITIRENDSVKLYYYVSGNSIVLKKLYQDYGVEQWLDYRKESGKLLGEMYYVQHEYIGIYRMYDEKGNVIDSALWTSPKYTKICYNEAKELIHRKVRWKLNYRNGNISVESRSHPIESSDSNNSNLEGNFFWKVIVDPKGVREKIIYPKLKYTIDARTGNVVNKQYTIGRCTYDRKVKGKRLSKER